MTLAEHRLRLAEADLILFALRRRGGVALLDADGRLCGFPRKSCLPFVPHLLSHRAEIIELLRDMWWTE